MRAPLTERQTAVLTFIKKFILDNNYPPLQSEIAAGFDISQVAARAHLKTLKKKGYIRLVTGAHRGIKLTKLAA